MLRTRTRSGWSTLITVRARRSANNAQPMHARFPGVNALRQRSRPEAPVIYHREMLMQHLRIVHAAAQT